MDEVDLLGKNKRARAAVMAEADAAHHALIALSVCGDEEMLTRIHAGELAEAVQTLSKCKYQMIALLEQQRKLANAAG